MATKKQTNPAPAPKEEAPLVQAASAIGTALGTVTKKVQTVVGRYQVPVAAVKKRMPRKLKKLAKQLAAKKAAGAK